MGDIRNYQMLIDGNWVDASDGGTFESVNPANGEIWSRVPEATEADVNQAVEAAHRGLVRRRAAPLSPRRQEVDPRREQTGALQRWPQQAGSETGHSLSTPEYTAAGSTYDA